MKEDATGETKFVTLFPADALARLFVVTLFVCAVILAIVSALVLLCIVRFRRKDGDNEPGSSISIPVGRSVHIPAMHWWKRCFVRSGEAQRVRIRNHLHV